MNAKVKAGLLAGLTLALVACGGGSSDSGSNITPDEAVTATACVDAYGSQRIAQLVNRCGYGVNVLLFGQRNVRISLKKNETKTTEALNTGKYIACRKPFSPRLEAPYCFK